MFKTVRYLNPRGCDRVVDLMDTIGAYTFPKVIPVIQMISVFAKIKPIEATTKLNTLLDKLEKELVKGNFNFILKNIPDSAPLSGSDIIETIRYPHMRDTLGQFGSISKLQIIRGTVYVKFTEPTSCVMCHSLVNNMQMGTNIITTHCI
jgi:hypothetical protein